MEYTSPGPLSMSVPRLLTSAVTFLVVASVSVCDAYSRERRYGPNQRHNIRHGRHRGGPNHHGKPQSYRGFSDYDYEDHTVLQKPEFLNTETNLTVVEGRMATLPCSVRYLGTKEVAWRRLDGKNATFLTVGDYKWRPDERLSLDTHRNVQQVSHYNLLIKSVNMKDAGMYQCQITDKVPHRIDVRLTVKPRPPPKPAAVKLTGEPFVDQGKPIKLVCNATGGARIPESVDWFKDGTKLDIGSLGHKLSQYNVVRDQALVSELVIEHTGIHNSGTYICRSSDKKIDSLKVTVLVAETTNKKRDSEDNGSHIGERDKKRHMGQDRDGAVFNRPPHVAVTVLGLLSVLLCTSIHRILS